jgi:hypothetical protein
MMLPVQPHLLEHFILGAEVLYWESYSTVAAPMPRSILCYWPLISFDSPAISSGRASSYCQSAYGRCRPSFKITHADTFLDLLTEGRC